LAEIAISEFNMNFGISMLL